MSGTPYLIACCIVALRDVLIIAVCISWLTS